MDKDVLDQRIEQLCREAVREAKAAVAAAPEGAWIAGSEWQVRQIFQRLTRDCYQLLMQARADAHPAADQAAFSPSARPGPAQQGRTFATVSDGQRRD